MAAWGDNSFTSLLISEMLLKPRESDSSCECKGRFSTSVILLLLRSKDVKFERTVNALGILVKWADVIVSFCKLVVNKSKAVSGIGFRRLLLKLRTVRDGKCANQAGQDVRPTLFSVSSRRDAPMCVKISSFQFCKGEFFIVKLVSLVKLRKASGISVSCVFVSDRTCRVDAELLKAPGEMSEIGLLPKSISVNPAGMELSVMLVILLF